MKETIYTIPINDAFANDCICPICVFEKEQEAHLIDYTLGASMMEPDERQRSNAVGYCHTHYRMLLENPTKLSLALVLESHIAELRQKLDREKNAIKPGSSLFQKKEGKQSVALAGNRVDAENSACLICQKLSAIMEKFMDNLFYLYQSDADFQGRFWSVQGFCLPHTALLLKSAVRNLNGREAVSFSQKILEREERYLAETQEDISWFTKKFDYRYKDEDWKNSKDAVPRAVAILSGQ